jgi:hypothetical protein
MYVCACTCVCNMYVHICIYVSTSIHIYTILHIVNECEPFSFIHRTKYNIIIENIAFIFFHSLCYNKYI